MKPYGESLKEYARGITGGLLFSLPMLYTMEVWQTGITTPAYELIIYLAVTFCLLIGYNRYAGMHEDATWKEILTDSVEEMGIGLVISAIVLWQLGQLHLTGMTTGEMMGKVIVESMTVAIGVSVGTAQLGAGGTAEPAKKTGRRDGKTAKIALALCGSVLIAGNIAPTDEVAVTLLNATPPRLLLMVAEALLLGAIIVFFSDFKRGRMLEKGQVAKTVVSDTCMAYFVSVSSSAFMLWFFGRFHYQTYYNCLSLTVILALPAMLGASAGRLLIKNPN